ncbi:MAG: histidinol-phosphate transaminase [gamma proteobacterium symbiont of Ctena orbiculata]|nr:MAG: histidinol-phosphate transaminase [gamma proteobacterium symbiont of Ctena orbiculata]PVV20723.1 MAG: histidinol-phosphate transaminase [gamma proteobacterium symbiont of Ctena orbiculata]PVV25511.1 MAG: histidinol-phosphate transaminase [gamma proteobacterium symbiont of Ctena orbiculata]
MSRYWSPIVSQLSPYVPGEQPRIDDLVKLNTNENPYGPSPRVIEAVNQTADDGLRLYPDPSSTLLRETVADYYDLTPQQVFIGNGSDEVLAHAFFALFQQSQPLLFPDITYSFYPVYCRLYGIEYQTIPLDAGFNIDLESYTQANGGIIFPNPNAPTGMLLPLQKIEWLLKHNRDSVVVIDEAYIDFGGESAATLIDRYPNLLVTQTLSKSRALAGLRIGLAMGNTELIEGLIRVKDSFNSYPMDRLAGAAAIASFKDEDYFRDSCRQIIEAREQLNRQLQGLGFQVLPSAANFLFAHHPSREASDIATQLRKQGVLVRHFRQPRISGFLRITIGTPQQNQRLVEVLGGLGLSA